MLEKHTRRAQQPNERHSINAVSTNAEGPLDKFFYKQCKGTQMCNPDRVRSPLEHEETQQEKLDI